MSPYKLSRPVAAALLATITAAVCAQDAAPPHDLLLTRPGWELGGQVSNYKYEEPDFMKLDGSRVGVVGAYNWTASNLVYARIDGRVSYGKLDYFSAPTGTVPDIPDWTAEVRLVAGRDYRVGESVALSPYIGLGYRYLYNDLRGYTTVGNATYAGYRRYSEYWYAPIGVTMRMRAGAHWVFAPTIEYDAFIGGKQKSQLTDTGIPTYQDITNRQDDGRGYRVYLMFEGQRWAFGPWFHYWNIKDSDVVFVGFNSLGQPVGGMEPANTTKEYGLELRYRF
ncbi:MAG TPA: outer membrane beta-barrel protein [Burkholderiales bacterium]|nr:outer membrane beta-barrel protein [Burkholderiales bacterium]